jgi:Tfp pilus assembly protein PilO
MEIASLQYLKSQISERIKTINERRVRYKKKSFWSYISISILAAISSIVLGLNLSCWKEASRIVALFISGLITVIGAYNAFFDHKQMWIANNNARNEFFKLSFEIEFAEKVSESISEEMVEKFKQEYQAILDRLNKTWTESRLK